MVKKAYRIRLNPTLLQFSYELLEEFRFSTSVVYDLVTVEGGPPTEVSSSNHVHSDRGPKVKCIRINCVVLLQLVYSAI